MADKIRNRSCVGEHSWKTLIFNGYGLGRECTKCGKQIVDDNEDADGY